MSVIPQGLLNPEPGQFLPAVVTEVEDRLEACLALQNKRLMDIDPDLQPLFTVIRSLIQAGGKRLRPAFVWAGYGAVEGQPNRDVFGPATAVEMLHTFALIHDDIMDRASTRRNVPTSHIAMMEMHKANKWVGDSQLFGQNSAILAGDLAAIWADELFEAPSLPPEHVALARTVFTTLRSEVMVGQWLDVRLAALPQATPAQSEQVALLKSGRYSVSRPLQLGAALAGVTAGPDYEALLTYGDALGIAFQLRDDMLGVFGQDQQMGKSAGSDLREGKRTVLILTTLERANETQKQHVLSVLGNQLATNAQLDTVREIIQDSGAYDQVERYIQQYCEQCFKAVEGFSSPSRNILGELAEMTINRSS